MNWCPNCQRNTVALRSTVKTIENDKLVFWTEITCTECTMTISRETNSPRGFPEDSP